MHISLQAMNIFYISLAIYTRNSFSVVQLPSFLKIKVFFFYLKSHCLRKNAAQNIPSGIETKRKLVLVTDKWCLSDYSREKLKNICCGSSFIGSTMVQLPEEGKITIFRLHLDGTRGWRRYHWRWDVMKRVRYGPWQITQQVIMTKRCEGNRDLSFDPLVTHL